MLARLSIRDIVLIDRLDIDFTSGLSVLTGETGAGKSIVVDALLLVTGARAQLDWIRTGADTAVVELSHVSYRTAEIQDMAAITCAAHGKGALIVWDLAHSTGAVELHLDRDRAQ